MRTTFRVLIAVAVILLDLLIFFLPLSAFFVGYIVIFNPPWFRQFLENLDRR